MSGGVVLGASGVALATGLVGWFIVLRAQLFAGDALGHVAFTGAAAAAAVGLDARIGLFAATVLAGLALGLLGRRAAADDETIGVGFAAVLGAGVLCLYLLAHGSHGGDGEIGARALFGSVFTLSGGSAWLAMGIGAAVAVVVAVAARPLLFATIDPVVAAARGVPVRALGLLLLTLLAVSTAEATQAVGALLALGLLAAPAGAAQRLTSHPWGGLALSAALALACTWAGLWLSVTVSGLPPSTAIILLAAGSYLLTRILRRRPRAAAGQA